MKKSESSHNEIQLSLKELSSTLQMYRQLVDNIREVLWIVSADWQEVHYISPAYEQVWGRSCESLRLNPLSWMDSVLEEDREKVTADIEKRREGNLDDPVFPEYRIRRPDGTVRWIWGRAYPVQDDQGHISRIVGIAEDITEQMEAIQGMRESESLLKTVAENIPNTYLSIIEKDMTVGFTSGEEFRKQGLDPETFVGLSIEEVFGEHALYVGKQYQGAFAGEKRQFELTIGGQHQEFKVIPLADEGGAVNRILAFVENVTEKKEAARKLQESEEKFRTAFRTSPDAIAISRISDGVLVDVNDAYVTETGYSRKETIGKSTVDLGLWADPSEREQFISLVAEKGFVRDFEMGFRTGGGEVGTCLLSASSLLLEGQPHLLTVVRNVTGMKEAQEAVRRERDLIDHLMEISPVGITVVSRDGQITFANRRAQQVLGLKKDKVKERTYNAPEWQITDLVGKPFPNDELPFMRVMSTSVPVFDVRHAIRWPDGRMVKLSINAVPMFDEQGQLDGMVASIEDVTERMAWEDALRESEERFRNIVQSSPMGMHMYRLEPDDRLVFVGANPVADRILGVDHTQFEGKTIEAAFPPLKDTEVPEAYRRVCAEGTPWFTEQINYEHGKISGAFEVHAFQTAPNTMAVMFLEITERLIAAEQIQESLKVKDTLLKEIHHRVKNNLQVISGLLDLQTHHLDDEKYRTIFKESQNRVMAMALIHQELYRAEDLESINFGAFIKNLSQTLIGSYTVHPDVVKLEHDVQNVHIVIDTAIPCGLIINELITNSLKHAFPGGRSGTIRITFRAVGECEYELIVADDGVGLPEDLDYSRTRSLGLQLVSILSDQLKSVVTIERDKGTSFSFRFREYREAGTILH